MPRVASTQMAPGDRLKEGSPIRVGMIGTSDLEGGAARAAYRLYRGLLASGMDVRFFVQDRTGTGKHVVGPETKVAKAFARLRPTLDELPMRLYSSRPRRTFSPAWVPSDVRLRVKEFRPDVVNLHWVCKGFVPVETLARLAGPLVWTLHDMWPFTGGCHYSYGCDRYMQACGQCPQLGSRMEFDLSRWVWRRKARAWGRADLTVVAPSRWMADCAARSSLLRGRRVEVIPYGIDTGVYRPIDGRAARQVMGLPLDRKLVLFSALKATDDPRKGITYAYGALRELRGARQAGGVELVIVGAPGPGEQGDLGLPTHYLGTLGDDIALAVAYSAADVFVAPSIEDNLPNTVLESLACGTPCVAFDIGGMPDMIVHGENGYLAQPYDVSDLARGIAWVLEDRERHDRLSSQARKKVEVEFALAKQARRYQAAFEDAVNKART